MFKKKRRLLIILLLIVVIVWLARGRFLGPTVPEGSFLLVPIDGEYPEQPPADLLSKLFGQTPPTVIDFVQTLRIASADKRIRGLIARVGSPAIGWAKTEEMRAALAAFKASGKPVYAVLENEAAVANKNYFLAAVADRLYFSPVTTAPLVGLAAEYLFLGDVWQKLDIEMHVEQIGKYKTAGDMLVKREMTAAHREMANSLLDSVDARFTSAIAAARGIDSGQVRALIDQGLTRGEEFRAAGLANGIKYVSEVRQQDAGGAPLVDFEDYEGVDPAAVGLKAKHVIAVVYGVGMIMTGKSGDSLLDGPVMGADTVAQALAEAAENDAAKAIIFRIDSPGGSALGADLIWKATQKARAKKPLIVSMSDVAASGGYYAAAGANRIIAHETTLTGSIGVVFSRPNIRGLLRRMGISTETLARGRYAMINNLTAPIDEEARQKIRTEIGHVYSQFVERVARGRNLSPERVDEIGRGRVWTGTQAVGNGLADEIGGFTAALRAAKVAAGIPESDEVEIVYYPRRKTLAEKLADALTARMAPHLGLTLPAELRAVRAQYPFAKPGILALMPEVILIK